MTVNSFAQLIFWGTHDTKIGFKMHIATENALPCISVDAGRVVNNKIPDILKLKKTTRFNINYKN